MTMAEIEAKKVSLEAELTTALEAAKVLTPATAEFDEAYGRYLAAKASIAKIPEQIAAAKLAENAEAIGAAGVTVAEGILQLVDGLKVADLLGVPVKNLSYVAAYTGEDNTVRPARVVFNPVAKVKATSGTKRTPGTGRTVIVDSEGNRLSLTKFVLAHATEAEKTEGNEAFLKYPHVAVDTKPKFEKFCEAHSLAGYTYETAQAGGEDAS